MRHQEILQRMGFTELTHMQKSMYEEVLKGKDTVLLSPTGSGKTMAFLLPIITKLEAASTKDNLQILVKIGRAHV